MRKLAFSTCLGLFLIAISASQIVLADLTPPSGQRNVYKIYVNVRFKYQISYPSNLVIPQGESTNSDGQIFRARDSSAEMRAYGRYNVNNETLRGVFADVLREWGDGVTYKVIRPDWFVVTALVNGKIHYQKTMLRRDVFKTFQIEYDASRRATYDAVTARIAKSFIG